MLITFPALSFRNRLSHSSRNTPAQNRLITRCIQATSYIFRRSGGIGFSLKVRQQFHLMYGQIFHTANSQSQPFSKAMRHTGQRLPSGHYRIWKVYRVVNSRRVFEDAAVIKSIRFTRRSSSMGPLSKFQRFPALPKKLGCDSGLTTVESVSPVSLSPRNAV